ncbi:vWA domain-containing protein [Iodobacter fluviatilis]|uniref:Ca-activated chloride channel family protein n=1 Tax=Iodobacter fluviatilis TaxID=537 RepID=A0A377Q9I3_9NEIS|nr:VWA domain-containing protein [Iodobacter fluviatilis]TCU81915.1 Ca-activated chloride channel family protein [Iodobacter fluviatilis]STQ91552.1 Magnesium-chelatase 60 kDa subunit [Iodobacter fluviatilis]
MTKFPLSLSVLSGVVLLSACGGTAFNKYDTSLPHNSQPAERVAAPAPVASKIQAMAEAGVRTQPNAPLASAEPSRENYSKLEELSVKAVAVEPVSTFSIDVDTASYTNVRRFLQAGQLPPKDAVRVEEMINYFPYNYPHQAGSRPFAVYTEIAPAPWGVDKHLIRIGIKAQDIKAAALPAANLVFLVDVSGSMNEPNKLPLLQASLKLLVDQLKAADHVSLVTYASGTKVVLEPSADKNQIKRAIDQLVAGGGTAGAAGIQLAYQMARQGFIKGGINRILLATDGDFNVGVTSIDALKEMVEKEREAGVSLSTLGFGMGNYNDALMEQVADMGNGNYHYIDNLNEGQKVLVDEMSSTLATVAKDVKIQVEFNPEQVKEYRLIGYENRQLKREDFNNDKVDAGDIGAGHTVTALYEVTFAGKAGYLEPLRYEAKPAKKTTLSDELGFLRLRYKAPDSNKSQLIEIPLQRRDVLNSFNQASNEFRFATAVAGFGQLLRNGRYMSDFNYAKVAAIAGNARGDDAFGYRGEFLQLVKLAKSLTPAATEGGRD